MKAVNLSIFMRMAFIRIFLHNIFIVMSQKLKFKIISCSSQQVEYPVTSLLFAGSDGWQTRRFCTYPQEITLQFYGIVNIRKIELTSDHRKISSQVDILYYVPTGSQEERFYKYGYLQFNRNQNGNTRQQKTIMVDINCLYLRFLFHKPHTAKDNFFSQIGLQSLSLYGSEQPNALLSEGVEGGQGGDAREQQLNEEDEEYIAGYMALINKGKDEAIRRQDYGKAQQFKKVAIQVAKLAMSLRQDRAKIAQAIEREDYDLAKKIKNQIVRNKQQIASILDSDNQQQRPQQQQEQQNQFSNPVQDQNNNEFMEQEHTFNTLPQSKVSNKLQNSRALKPPRQIETKRQDYDERVIPAMRGDRQKQEVDEFGQQKSRELPPVEQVQGKYIKQATFMQQFFDQDTIRKFFSQYWQYNLQALNSILGQIKKKNKEAGLIKCLTSVVKLSIKQTNFQVSLVSLSILQEMIKTNKESQSITKPGEMQNDLDEIGRQVMRKMTDNNPKIKAAADQAFALMISSLLYGVEACSILLTKKAKSQTKLSSKQITTRMIMIAKMIDDYGLASGTNTVPTSTLDFAIENLNHSAEEVRKNAVALLATAYRRDKNKTEGKIANLKDSIQRQIRGEDIANTPPRNKKK